MPSATFSNRCAPLTTGAFVCARPSSQTKAASSAMKPRVTRTRMGNLLKDGTRLGGIVNWRSNPEYQRAPRHGLNPRNAPRVLRDPRSAWIGWDGRGLSRPRHEAGPRGRRRSEEHTSELQSHSDLVCRLLLEKKK